jgi:hypothetical protein
MGNPHRAGTKSISLDDIWQRKATAAAIAAVRNLISGDAIPKATLVGRLTDIELGWLIASGLFAWIRTRAEQATAEGWDIEQTLHVTGFAPEPWDAGCAASILPRLVELDGINWERPIAGWSKDDVVRFLLAATKLINAAVIARDRGGSTVTTQHKPLEQMQCIASAEAGGGLVAPGELNDDVVPFEM